MSFLTGVIFHCFAQEDQPNAYYLNDDHISASRNVIKLDAIALVHGELPVTWERALTRRFSAEGGLGILLPYYVHDFLPLIFNSHQGFTNNKFGNSVWLKARLYEDRAPELGYMDFTFRRRNFSSVSVTDLSFGIGNQLMVRERFVLDYSLGVGVRFQKTSGEENIFDPDRDMTLIVPLQIKVGYLF